MTSLETDNPGTAATVTGADTEADTQINSTTSSARQAPQRNDPSLLITLAAWLIRLVLRRRERKMQHGWDEALSVQLEPLTDAGVHLANYLSAERWQP